MAVLLPLQAQELQAQEEQAQEPLAQIWYLILIGGKRAGSQSEVVWRQPDGSFRTELTMRLSMSRFGQTVSATRRQSWIEGESLRSVDWETDMNGAREILSVRVQQEGLRLKVQRAGFSSEHLLPGRGKLFGPRGVQDRLRLAFAASRLADPRDLSLMQFSTEAGAVEESRLHLLGAGELADSLGAVHGGQRVDIESSAVPGVRVEAVYDEHGELEYSVTRVGVALEVVRAANGEVTAAGSPAAPASDLELFDVASLSIPVRWPAALQGPEGAPHLGSLQTVTLRFTGPALPELERAAQAEQAELGSPSGRREGQALVLKFDAPSAAPAWPRAAAGGEFTGDGFYLDLGDPRLEDLASRCEPPDFACLERLVDRTIRIKSLRYGFAGVREVLDSRSGDCTEHALLLAALLRKRGVPARIGYGFLLTETGFVGHAWTEARAGAGWFALDPSFPGGRPYAFKLRLGVIDPAAPVWGQLGVSLLAVAGGVQAEVMEAASGR